MTMQGREETGCSQAGSHGVQVKGSEKFCNKESCLTLSQCFPLIWAQIPVFCIMPSDAPWLSCSAEHSLGNAALEICVCATCWGSSTASSVSGNRCQAPCLFLRPAVGLRDALLWKGLRSEQNWV